MKLVELMDLDCQELGLYYIPDEMTIDEAQDIFESCHKKAEEISKLDKQIDVQDAFETYLEQEDISRTFVDFEVMVKGF
jgi:hypothetical protein